MVVSTGTPPTQIAINRAKSLNLVVAPTQMPYKVRAEP